MLSALILLPLLGAALIGFLPVGMNGKLSRSIALVFASLAFAWIVFLAVQFNPTIVSQQFAEFLPWIDALGLNYYLGIDGLSLPLLLLNGLLTGIAIYSTDEDIQRPRFYYSLLLLLSAGVSGAFLAQDLLLFFLFYELELIPLYLLIAIWGGQRRGYAATKFLIYTAFSGILILASFLGLVWLSGSPSFALESLNSKGLPLATQILLLAGILVGFGIKIPLVPFHTWLPDAHVDFSPVGWRIVKVGNIRLTTLWHVLITRCLEICISRFGYLGSNQRPLWRILCDRPKRHEKNGGIQFNWTHGLHLVSCCCCYPIKHIGNCHAND